MKVRNSSIVTTLPHIILALAELWDMRMSALFLRETFEKYDTILFKWSREGVNEDCTHRLALRERSWGGWRIYTYRPSRYSWLCRQSDTDPWHRGVICITLAWPVLHWTHDKWQEIDRWCHNPERKEHVLNILISCLQQFSIRKTLLLSHGLCVYWNMEGYLW